MTEKTKNHILLAVAVTAAALIHISIAGSQILLGVGIALLLLFRHKLEFPRIWIPLLALFLWTLLADLLSQDAWGGRPQIRKFFVFLFIPLLYGVFVHQFGKVFYLMAAWTMAATASGVWGLVQYVLKYQHARSTGEDFYITYIGHRITGFESHWMTFGALQLSVLSLLLAQWFFSNRKFPVWAYASVAILGTAILLGQTRSIWLATVPSVLYLVWFWRPKMTLLVPLLIVLAFAIGPANTRQRLMSLVRPREDVDSNAHRLVTFRTGVRMIEAHPWFGLGPEEIGRNFQAYVPPDVKRLPVGYYGHLHNIYLQYAAERGIPGLLCVLWMIGLAMWDYFGAVLRLGPERSQQRFVLHGAIAVTIGVLVGGFAEYNLGDSEVLMMFVSVLALGYAAVRNVNVQPMVLEQGARDSGSDGRLPLS